MNSSSPPGPLASPGESPAAESIPAQDGARRQANSQQRRTVRGPSPRKLLAWRWIGVWLVTWAGLTCWRANILTVPPYGDGATGLFVEADWLESHQFDYRRLWHVEESFSAGGPRAHATSLLPTAVALLFRAGISQTAVQLVMHLVTLACAAALLVMVFALLQNIVGKWGSVAIVAAIVTTPLWSVQIEMLGPEVPMATLAVAAVLLALRGHWGWAALAATASFAMQNTGIIATAAIWLYAAAPFASNYLAAQDRTARSLRSALGSGTEYLGFALLSIALVVQVLLIGWANSLAPAVAGVPRSTRDLGLADLLTICPDIALLAAALAISTGLIAIAGARKSLRDRAVSKSATSASATTANPSTWHLLLLAFASRPELVLGWLVVVALLTALLLSGALLPRNFTLAVPFLYIVAGAMWLRNARWRSLALGGLALLVIVNLVNRAGLLFPQLQIGVRAAPLRERSHEYRADQRAISAALHAITTNRQADEALVAASPLALYLALPRLGYVEQPQPGYAASKLTVGDWPSVARLFKDHPRRLMIVSDKFAEGLAQVTAPPPGADDSPARVLYSDEPTHRFVVYRRDLSELSGDETALDRWYLEHFWYDGSLDRRPALPLLARAKSLAKDDCRPQAMELLRLGLADTPDDLDLQLELARQLIDAGQIDEGLAIAHEVAWADDQRADAFDVLGRGRMQQGQIDLAVAEFRAAIERDPDLDDARYHLALAYFRQSDASQVKSTLRDLLARNPDYHDARLQLGTLALVIGKFDDAVVEFDELLRRDPRAETAFAAGSACLQQQRPAEAERYFRAAIERQPDHAQAKNYLGLLLLGRGDNEAAERQFRAALVDQPSYAEPYNNLGVVLAKTNRLAEAETQLRAAIRLAPNYADAYNNLGMLLAQNQNLSAARECFVQALRSNPNFQHAQQNLQRVDARLKGSTP